MRVLLVRALTNIKTAFTSGVGESLNAAVIFVAFTVERDGGNAGGERAFRDLLTDNGGGFDISAVGAGSAEFFFVRAGARERFPFVIVDNLHANVARATEDAKSRTNADFFNRVRNSVFAS